MKLVGGGMVGLALAACAFSPEIRTPPNLGPGTEGGGVFDEAFASTVLLSAQLTRAYWDDQLEPAVLLVFSRRIDAASVDPRHFLVILENGRRVVPARALLAPANEADEHRSVALLGNFTATGDERPIHVIVAGPIYSVAGDSLQQASTTVENLGRPPRLVASEVLKPNSSRCDGHAGLIRTYWSNVLRGVELGDRTRVNILFPSGNGAHPDGFDDHHLSPDGGESREDNVLDLCFDGNHVPVSLEVTRGAFADPEQHPSDPVQTGLE